MKYSKILAAILVNAGLFSSQANATLIDLGYSLNESANVITDSSRNIEWLQWDVSSGLSISEGLAIYSGQGWRLANNRQMANLMNDAGFGAITSGSGVGGGFDSSENTSQNINLTYTPDEVSAANIFIQMFGDTFLSEGYVCCGGDDSVQLTRAIFGDDENGNGFYNSASVLDDYQSFDGSEQNGFASMTAEKSSFTFSNKQSTYGLALVRSLDVSPVPVPSSLPLLALALFGFGCIHRRELNSTK